MELGAFLGKKLYFKVWSWPVVPIGFPFGLKLYRIDEGWVISMFLYRLQANLSKGIV